MPNKSYMKQKKGSDNEVLQIVDGASGKWYITSTG